MANSADQKYADARDVWVDPVSHESVNPRTAEHRSFYAGHMYHFSSLASKETFDEDPELWVPTPHASVISSALPADDSE